MLLRKRVPVYNENDEGKDNWSDFDLFVFDELSGTAGLTAEELAKRLSEHLGEKVSKKTLGDTLYEGKISRFISRNPTTRRWTLNK